MSCNENCRNTKAQTCLPNSNKISRRLTLAADSMDRNTSSSAEGHKEQLLLVLHLNKTPEQIESLRPNVAINVWGRESLQEQPTEEQC